MADDRDRPLRLEECGDVLTVRELAAVLRLDPRTIYGLLAMHSTRIPPQIPDPRRHRWSRESSTAGSRRRRGPNR